MGQEFTKTDTTVLRKRSSQSECSDLEENRLKYSHGILDYKYKFSHPLMETRSYSNHPIPDRKFSHPIFLDHTHASSQSNQSLLDSRPSSSQSNHGFLDMFPSLSNPRLRLVSSQPDLHLIDPPRKQRILMLGLDGAGKSTLFQRIRETKKGIHTKVPNEPTIAYNVTSLDFDGRPCTLWDVSGSPLTRDLWKHYLSGTDCLVWVVDSSRLCRIQESRDLLHKIVSNQTMRSVPLVVVANKQDLPTARTLLELEEMLQLDEIREQGHFVKVITTSATTGKDTRKVLKKCKKVLSKSKSSNFNSDIN
ncbi:hypothetical protein LOD99_9973 [Oopsacas minuta]|uniref:Uncharacterized protein n=1 Tax=Oopsacas minuta TaxID=111878 RepID=A0AAV7KKR0_9METZ|nr:hypothetical protein LOD99_9973 [Oopsacas minuta]